MTTEIDTIIAAMEALADDLNSRLDMLAEDVA